MSNAISVESNGDVLVITFDRPEVRNPISVEVIDSIERALVFAADVRRIVFTGRDGIFASGADLREIAGLDRASAREFAERGQSLMEAISQLPAETVSLIDGPCYGGALDLALACRRRLATSRSTFCHPGARLGIMTGWGGTQRLPRLVGETAALEMFLTAEPIDAVEALRIGLIDAILAGDLSTAGTRTDTIRQLRP
jgi:enoyl-CoA hydratase